MSEHAKTLSLAPSSAPSTPTPGTEAAAHEPRKKSKVQVSIWWYALGYFACYVPFSAMTKAVSGGFLPGGHHTPVSGTAILPGSVMASFALAIAFVFLSGWWHDAHKFHIGPITLPRPSAPTLWSGMATAVIIVTTTLAYTIDGVSIVFMMLLMRGGVLVLAPVIDSSTGRKVKLAPLIALFLSLGALVAAFLDRGGFDLHVVAVVDIVAYLLAYFLRLRLMSRNAKNASSSQTRRYFVEEQLVAVPALLTVLGALALFHPGELGDQLRLGFTDLLMGPQLGPIIFIGLLSQGTGIFGGLILLDRRANTFCVPVNRASSILAGAVASTMLAMSGHKAWPGVGQYVGAGLLVVAIFVLAAPSLLAKAKPADD